jgi:hypothetical protein
METNSITRADYEASEGERLGGYVRDYLCVGVQGDQLRVISLLEAMDDDTLIALSGAISERLHAKAVEQCSR